MWRRQSGPSRVSSLWISRHSCGGVLLGGQDVRELAEHRQCPEIAPRTTGSVEGEPWARCDRPSKSGRSHRGQEQDAEADAQHAAEEERKGTTGKHATASYWGKPTGSQVKAGRTGVISNGTLGEPIRPGLTRCPSDRKSNERVGIGTRMHRNFTNTTHVSRSRC